MKHFITVFIAVLLLVNGVIFAGPLDKSEVDKNAKWIVHIDNEQLGRTVIGGLIRKNIEIEQDGTIAEIEELAELLSFNPFDDSNDITIYGQNAEENEFVVIADGNFDKEQILSLVPENIQHEVIPYGQTELYSWQEKVQTQEGDTGIKYDGEIKLDTNQGEVKINASYVNQTIYGCFFSDKLIVLSPDLDTIKSAIDVLNGTAENAQGTGAAANSNESIFFRVFVSNIGTIAGQEPKAAILKETETLEIVVGENDGLFFVNVDLVTKSVETAAAIETMLRGILAFAAVTSEEEPQVAELASKITILGIDNSVQVRFESEPKALMELMKKEWKEELERQIKKR